jgi:hypothetical protein
MDVSAVITVAPDATATGTYEVALDREIAGVAGIDSLDEFESSVAEGDMGLPDGASLSFREEDSAYVMSAAFTGIPLQEDDLAAEVLEDGRVRMTFRNLGSADEGGTMGLADGSLSITVTMPGRIDAVDGFEQLDEDTVTWSGSLTDSVNALVISDPAETGSSDGMPVLPIVLGGVLVAAIAIGLMRQRRAV